MRSTARTIALLYENISRRFTLFGQDSAYNYLRNKFSAAVTGTLFANLSSSLSVNYQINAEPTQVDPWAVNLSIFTRLGDFSTTFNLGRQRTIDGKWSNQASIFATFYLPEENSYITAQGDRNSNYHRIGIRRNSPYPVNGFNSGLEVEQGPDHQSMTGDLTYFHEKIIATINGTATNIEHEQNQEQMGLTLSSALVFAGNQVAITRPVSNSFAIVTGEKSLAGKQILVNPHQGYAEADTTTLGPAVIPNMIPYAYQQLHLSPVKLDPGLFLPQEYFTLKPTYRSGTKVEVGHQSNILLQGRLVDNDGVPITLAVGEIIPLATSHPITFFTNRQGHFEIEGLNAGIYTIRLHNREYHPLELTLSRQQQGVVNIGALRVMRDKK